MCSRDDAETVHNPQQEARNIQPELIYTEKMTLPRKLPVSSAIMKRIKKTIQPAEGETYLVNRNPRNLEFLRVAHKPVGYKLDKPGRSFWNKYVSFLLSLACF